MASVLVGAKLLIFFYYSRDFEFHHNKVLCSEQIIVVKNVQMCFHIYHYITQKTMKWIQVGVKLSGEYRLTFLIFLRTPCCKQFYYQCKALWNLFWSCTEVVTVLERLRAMNFKTDLYRQVKNHRKISGVLLSKIEYVLLQQERCWLFLDEQWLSILIFLSVISWDQFSVSHMETDFNFIGIVVISYLLINLIARQLAKLFLSEFKGKCFGLIKIGI